MEQIELRTEADMLATARVDARSRTSTASSGPGTSVLDTEDSGTDVDGARREDPPATAASRAEAAALLASVTDMEAAYMEARRGVEGVDEDGLAGATDARSSDE